MRCQSNLCVGFLIRICSLPILSIFLCLFSCQSTENSSKEGLQSYGLRDLSELELEKGAHLFRLQCARCHGMNGSGGNGPSLRRNSMAHAPNDTSLMSVIQYGIPGTEMPGTWLLTPPDVRLIAGYVRSLKKVEIGEVHGNSKKGMSTYTSKGACRLCHIINGDGGSLGPDLTRVGAKRSPDFIRQSLIRPGFFKKEREMANTVDGFVQNLVFKVRTGDGQEITGMRVNEDAFTLQLRDVQNKFYSFRKKDLLELKKLYEKSLMPSVKGILTDEEIDDLVAYLVSLK